MTVRISQVRAGQNFREITAVSVDGADGNKMRTWNTFPDNLKRLAPRNHSQQNSWQCLTDFGCIQCFPLDKHN